MVTWRKIRSTSSRRNRWPASRERSRRVDQAEVHDFDAGPLEPRRHLRHIAFEPLLESRKLRPVGVESDAEQAHAQGFSALIALLCPSGVSGQIKNLFHHGEALAGTQALVGRKERRHRLLPAQIDGVVFDPAQVASNPPPAASESAARRGDRWSTRGCPRSSAGPASPATPRDGRFVLLAHRDAGAE